MPEPISNIVEANLDRVAEIERDLERQITPLERRLHRVTRRVGTLPVLIGHLFVVAAWVFANSPFVMEAPFDPAPYFLLVTLLAIETISLTIVVLMTQNYMQRVTELKIHLMLQMLLLDEQKTTKVLEVLARSQGSLGFEDGDERLATLAQPTRTEDVITTIREAVDEEEGPKSR